MFVNEGAYVTNTTLPKVLLAWVLKNFKQVSLTGKPQHTI